MIVLSILFLIFELMMIIFLVDKIRKCKQISIKDTVIYPFLILVSAFVMGVSHAAYLPHEKWYESLTYASSNAIDIIKLSIDDSLLKALQEQNTFMLVNYLLLYFISALALFSLSLSLVKTIVKNLARVKIFNKEISYVFGLNAAAKTYLGNLSRKEKQKTCVVLEEESDNRSRNADKLYLSDAGIKYYVLPYGDKTDFSYAAARLTASKKKQYYLLGFFDSDKDVYSFTRNAQSYLRENALYGKNVRFVIFAASRQTPFVKELIKGNPRGEVVNANGKTVKLADESRGDISVYDKSSMLAYSFLWKHNLAKYFPKNLLSDNCTVKDCDINLYMLGFGEVNQALMNDLLIQTQFVTERDGALAPLRLNVAVYDKFEKLENISLSYGFLKYDEKNYCKENYFDLPEGYASHVKCNFGTDIGGVNFINDIYDEIKERGKKKPQVNYFIVALGNDCTNSLIATRLADSLSLLGEGYTNTYFVRCKQSLKLPDNDFVYFGDERDVLTYKNLIADAVYEIAKTESCIYEGRPVTDANIRLEWSTLSRIKQESNLYAVASIPFKLALLGFDGYDLTDEEYFAKYDPDGERNRYTYSEKLSLKGVFSARDALAFSEHERWTAYELSAGALPMKIKLSLVKDENGNATFINKTANETYHLCITTAKGLNQYHDYVEKINKEYGLNETSDVIKYDYDLMDNLTEHLKRLKKSN